MLKLKRFKKSAILLIVLPFTFGSPHANAETTRDTSENFSSVVDAKGQIQLPLFRRKMVHLGS